MSRIKVYYNSACPVCNAGIEGQKRRMEGCPMDVEWIDIHARADAVREIGAEREFVRERLHVVDEEGTLRTGADALEALWRHTRGQKWLARLLRLPFARGAARWAYNRFAARLYAWNRSKERWQVEADSTPPAAADTTATESATARAAAAYNAAADRYDDPANSFWERFGRDTIERLRLRRGERVLDVCCGSGASAIPAAEAVGPDGFVHGVDLAENLLRLACLKASAAGLSNVEFRAGNMLDLDYGDAEFDVVVCVFGIFFVPDMSAAVRELWRVVRPGGRLAVTTWGPRFFEPANTAFWNSIREVRPDLYKGFNPWDRICDPPSLRALLREGGVEGADVEAVAGSHELASPEAWWAAILGSGYRGTVEQLDANDRERVRAANLDYIRRARLRAVEANVVYAVATRS